MSVVQRPNFPALLSDSHITALHLDASAFHHLPDIRERKTWAIHNFRISAVALPLTVTARPCWRARAPVFALYQHAGDTSVYGGPNCGPFHLGIAQTRQGRFEEALASFKRADTFDTPSFARWTWLLGAGMVYILMERYEQALPWLERILCAAVPDAQKKSSRTIGSFDLKNLTEKRSQNGISSSSKLLSAGAGALRWLLLP
jgi:tetratricopeptide (TPR) repeat protein